jgi:ABC-type bacteriocin/lantibiotic exporter with double-glycine peptidase domain
VLLLDEATSALDFETEWQVLKNILAASHKRTVVVTTHRPAVLKSCTRVYTIERGNARAMTNEEVKNFAQRAVEE